MAPPTTPPEIRFWKFVVLGQECWEWIGGKSQWGYGIFHRPTPGQVTMQAHRFSYLLIKGRIPDGLVLDHLCKNRGCVNPEHLEAVTQKENILRSSGKIGKPVEYCRQGHFYDERNTYLHRGGKTCKICKIERQRGYRANAQA